MSLICGKWQLTKKRQSGNISLLRDGERKCLLWKLFRILRRLAIVIWLEEEDLCTILVLCPNEFPVRREDKIVSPPLYVSPKYAFVFVRFWKEFPLHFLSKESPFHCLQRFWTRCAKCSRCKLVAAMHRKCYWQECRRGRQCGNVAIGLGANWDIQHIIRYITNTIQ